MTEEPNHTPQKTWNEHMVYMVTIGAFPLFAMAMGVVHAFVVGVSVLILMAMGYPMILLLRRVLPYDLLFLSMFVFGILASLIALFVQNFFPYVYSAMGPFYALLVINTLILGRVRLVVQEMTVLQALVYGLKHGSIACVALVGMGILRDWLGRGWLDLRWSQTLEYHVPLVVAKDWGFWGEAAVRPAGFFAYSMGAFVMLAFFLVGVRAVDRYVRQGERHGGH